MSDIGETKYRVTPELTKYFLNIGIKLGENWVKPHSLPQGGRLRSGVSDVIGVFQCWRLFGYASEKMKNVATRIMYLYDK